MISGTKSAAEICRQHQLKPRGARSSLGYASWARSDGLGCRLSSGRVFRYNADWGALRVTATTTTLDLAFYRLGDDRHPVDHHRLTAVASAPSETRGRGRGGMR